jgi:sigma-B regulation protein RsbU (phosphoserine phosphatase)
LFCGVAKPTGEVEVCNAGHPPALWLREDEVVEIPATGLPVGIFCDTAFSVRKLGLAPGDTLLLYTDGLTESEDAAGSPYGTTRLAQLVSQQRRLPPDELVAACAADLMQFKGGAPQEDDVTIMAIRRGRR